ncbi:hypothetical protein HPB49_004470 [Dermacentor silvarum]|uniref:Uncharacterized protein n=1 Tax=Dermacentor silvarum TaxID=543639 RepID=A0ACB8DU89_DERSI|nr:hypothetical protein HPB49_004470 [Dermacentor silvarum]
MDPGSFGKDCDVSEPCRDKGSAEASTSHPPPTVTTCEGQGFNRGSSWKKIMRAKWRRDPWRPSHNIGSGDGPPGLLEPRATQPDESQVPSIVEPSKVSMPVMVADDGASAKEKCTSPGDGKKNFWTRLFRFGNGKKHGGHQKSGQRTASVRDEMEMRKEEGSGLSCSSQVSVFPPAVSATAALPVLPLSEDAGYATREHRGHKINPKTNKSQDSSRSFHGNVECLDAVSAETLRIQQAPQQPCIHNEGPRFTWTLVPLNKTPPVASSARKCSETGIATSHTCISEEFLHKPRPKMKGTLQTDDVTTASKLKAGASVEDHSAHTILFMVPEVKENTRNAPKDMQVQSPVKANEARIRKYSELLSHSGVLVLNQSQEPAVAQPGFFRAAESDVEWLPDSTGEHHPKTSNEKTLCLAANNVQDPASSTIVDEFPMVRDTVTEIGESSMQVSSIHIAAHTVAPDANSNDLVSFSTNINKSAVTVTPSSSLGAGAGARPKSGTARVTSKTKVYSGTHLPGTRCMPRTRDEIKKLHSMQRDSPKDMHRAWQQDVEKNKDSLLLEFEEEEQNENYEEPVLHHKNAELQSMWEERFALLKKRETLLAQLRSQNDVIRRLEDTARRLEQKEKELERQKAQMEEMVNELEAENAVLRQEALEDPGHQEGG